MVELIREKISRLGADKLPGSNTKAGLPYQPIPFAEFSDVDSKERAQTVREYNAVLMELGITPQHLAASGIPYSPDEPMTIQEDDDLPDSVLDIGANVGYFILQLAQRRKPGSRFVAVESDPANVDVLKALADWKGIDLRIVPSVDEIRITERYELVLMLNVHQWLDRAYGQAKTFRIMSDLCEMCELLIFQTAHAESVARDISNGEDARVVYLNTEEEIHAYLYAAGFAEIRTIMKSYSDFPRFMVSARGRLTVVRL